MTPASLLTCLVHLGAPYILGLTGAGAQHTAYEGQTQVNENPARWIAETETVRCAIERARHEFIAFITRAWTAE